MDLQKAREKFAEINLKHGFYTQEELKFTDLGVFECTAAEQDFDMWWECLIYYAQPLIDQKEKALLEQFEINNKLVERVEKLKAQAVPEGFVLVPKELTHEQAVKISDHPEFFEIYQNIVLDSDTSEDSVSVLLRIAHKAMIAAAQEPTND